MELELPEQRDEYHKKAHRFNLARNALVVHLLSLNAKTIYLPCYCCSSLTEALSEYGLSYIYYNINVQLEIKDEIHLNEGEYLLYVNYFGLKSKFASVLAEKFGDKLVIDNSQSFFSCPPRKGGAIYSARKFFGVPDGAYLYRSNFGSSSIDIGSPKYSVDHLIGRIEFGPEESYIEYRKSENLLRSTGIARMSNFSIRMLSCADYENVKRARVNNFNALDEKLSQLNLLDINSSQSRIGVSAGEAPMVYPFLTHNGVKLKKYLIRRKVFVASYWHDVLENMDSSELEKNLAENLVPLPVDQRYSEEDMQYIIDVIKEWVNG